MKKNKLIKKIKNFFYCFWNIIASIIVFLVSFLIVKKIKKNNRKERKTNGIDIKKLQDKINSRKESIIVIDKTILEKKKKIDELRHSINFILIICFLVFSFSISIKADTSATNIILKQIIAEQDDLIKLQELKIATITSNWKDCEQINYLLKKENELLKSKWYEKPVINFFFGFTIGCILTKSIYEILK